MDLTGRRHAGFLLELHIVLRLVSMKHSFLAVAVVGSVLSSAASAAEIGRAEICKATIAAVMGRDPKIIKIDRESEGIEYLSYVRGDGSFWSYRCRLEGVEVIWASDTGRWRTHLDDGKIYYEVAQDRSSVTITQSFSDGSKGIDRYTADRF